MQKKIVQQQPQVRKIFTTTVGHQQQQQQQSTMQLNAVKKINSLLQSGTVSVTGITSGQQRVMQKKPLLTSSTTVSITSTNSNNYNRQQKCYICGENAGINATLISEASTTTTQTEYVAKLAKVIGPNYSVVLSVEDVICRRCITILNQFDKLESEMDHLRGTLLGFIHKKNNIPEDADQQQLVGQVGGSPPAKMQKLTQISTAGSGGTVTTMPSGVTYSIKSVGHQQQQQADRPVNTSGGSTTNLNTSADVEAQLSSMFEKDGGNVSGTGTTGGVAQLQTQQKHIVVPTNNGGTASVTINAQGTTTPVTAAPGNTGVTRKASKLYKCMPCGFKTSDLALFQPHYEHCTPRAAVTAVANVANPSTAGATTTTSTTTTTTSTSTFRCKVCKMVFATIALLKQHNLQEHPMMVNQQQQLAAAAAAAAAQKTSAATSASEQQQQTVSASGQTIYICPTCNFKTADRHQHNEHLRKHIKLRPFKCRVCLLRFETRDQASLHAKQHQPDYFKCGICNVTFNRRDLLMGHLEQHENTKKEPQGSAKPQPQQQPQQQQQLQAQEQQQQQQQVQIEMADSSTQKLLQESIDEALRDSMGDAINAKLIQFHTCESCSLTFLSEKLYTQHIKTHGHGGAAGGGAGTPGVVTAGLAPQPQQQQQQLVLTSNTASNPSSRKTTVGANSGNLTGTTVDGGSGGLSGKILTTSTSTSGGVSSGAENAMSDGDLESIFERMHSDPKVSESTSGPGVAATTEGGSMVVTNQDGTTGNITFNITLPQQDDGTAAFVQQQQQEQQQSVGIDMPTLDQGDEQQQQQQKEQQHMQNVPVSMPSLDDDGEQSQNSQNSNTENVPMELEDIQGAEGQQIKFILNEEGQLLQLGSSHIITTDAEGNQILVQGANNEHLQQLLQSVGVVMHGGEGLGEGETLQMISGDGQNQMILVQGADGQEQLIDASLLHADGSIVLQQSQDGELNAEGTHITTEDGLQIPVSVAFTTSGEVDQEGHLTVSVAEGSEQQLQLHLQQAAAAAAAAAATGAEVDEHHQQLVGGDDGSVGQQQHNAILTEGGQIILQQKGHDEQSDKAEEQHHHDAENGPTTANVTDGEDGSDGQRQTTTNGANDSAIPVTTFSGNPNGTTISTSTAAAAAAAAAAGISVVAGPVTTTTAESAEDQMFNFDELIQPQIVIKHQQVRN